MKRAFSILGIVFGGVVLLLAAAAAYIQWTPLPTFEVNPPEVRLPVDSASLARGEKLAKTTCATCHLGEDSRLSGRLFSRPTDPFGELWSANITRHPTKGIGRYTDGELAYLIRTGVNREGRMTGYMMCRPGMSDDDLAALIAYLRSDDDITRPSEATHPAPAYLNMFLVKAMMAFGMFAPLSYDGHPIAAPQPADEVAYGQYLATQIYECYSCHSASFETNDLLHPEKSAGFFGGGNPVPDEAFNEVVSPNITPSREHGIGAWTKEEFLAAVRTGVRPDQRILGPQMPRFAALSEEEVSAIWAYIQTVPALENTPVVKAK